jgi:hypothetical protein
MSDQWKAEVRTIAGIPTALVDITIRRTLLIDPTILEEIGSLLGEANLDSVDGFTELIQKVPPELRKYTIIPWSDTDEKRINILPFGEIIKRFEPKTFWRVEGTAEIGFTGVFNLGGIDHRIDMSEAALPAFKDRIDKTETDCKTDYDDGKIKREVYEAVRNQCDHMNGSRIECSSLYAIQLEIRREQERQRREQLKQECADREHQQREKTEYIGDFPDGFGDKFSDMA